MLNSFPTRNRVSARPRGPSGVPPNGQSIDAPDALTMGSQTLASFVLEGGELLGAIRGASRALALQPLADLARSRFPAPCYFRPIIKSAYDKWIKMIQDAGAPRRTRELGSRPSATPRERR